jgi:hypothetical protein
VLEPGNSGKFTTSFNKSNLGNTDSPLTKTMSQAEISTTSETAHQDPVVILAVCVLMFFLKDREKNESFSDERLSVTLRKISLSKLTLLDLNQILRKAKKLMGMNI